jgi:hypothetical protein
MNIQSWDRVYGIHKIIECNIGSMFGTPNDMPISVGVPHASTRSPKATIFSTKIGSEQLLLN